MATIKERKDQDGKSRFQAIIRLKGQPIQTATFGRITDAKKWIQQTESAIREGRYFKTSAAKRYTLGEMIDRYIQLFHPPRAKEAHLVWWKERTERYIHLATKLFNAATQTMQALTRYKAKGQQTVQVIHVHNEG